jgi:ribulose-phosphate 3-epimerase
MRPVHIAPSVLPVDFSRLGDAIRDLDAAGVDRIQWDVMDGQFVPNLTFGPDVIASTRGLTSLPFEAHLMVRSPDAMAARWVEAGCQRLIVHAEACTHLHRTLGAIRDLGATAGVALNPSTPAAEVAHVLDLVDLVLVMTVNPGFGGQRYIATMEPKIAEVRDMIRRAGLDDAVDLEVDGGNVLVAGSALFRDPRGLGPAVADLRAAATAR